MATCLAVASVEKVTALKLVFAPRYGYRLRTIISFEPLVIFYVIQFEEFCILVLYSIQVFCCFANSVASTRFMLQDEFNIQTTECDNCIIVWFPLSIHLFIKLLVPCSSLPLTSLHFFAGLYVMPLTTCLHMLHNCLLAWK